MDIGNIVKAMQDTVRCGAKTRHGGLCRNAPMGQSKRCRMHGGASLKGEASPRWKHGRYSRYVLNLDRALKDIARGERDLARWAVETPTRVDPDELERLSIEIGSADLERLARELCG